MLHTHQWVAQTLVTTKGNTELCQAIAIRMRGAIALPLLLAGHALAGHLFTGGRKKSLKGNCAGIHYHRSLFDAEKSVKLCIVLGKELLIGKA